MIKNVIFWLSVSAVMIVCIIMNRSYNKEEEQIVVGIHVKGEVNAPGYYELPYGSRIKDAVKYAGGEKDNADLSKLNLAMKLRDGEEIQIPSKDAAEETFAREKININTADVCQLCKIDGIGEKVALRIVAYRAKKGRFKTIEEIKNVKGIGSRNFIEIKDEITV